MKFRIFLRSFDNDLINLASKDLSLTLSKTDCDITGIISLPVKIKRFCVLRSPHVDKDSREHFEIRLYKRFMDITCLLYTSPSPRDRTRSRMPSSA